MKNPLMVHPNAYPTLEPFLKAAKTGPIPHLTLHLVYLRASQLNGCAFCIDMHARDAKAAGDTDARLHLVAGWREARGFTPAERAALALTEAVTNLDPRDPVPDTVWAEAAKHYDETAMAQLLINIALINFFNRTNVPVRTPAGAER